MKKFVVAALSAALLSTAVAGTASTSITINANVLSSCEFDTGATAPASFNYDALTGTSDAVSGGATLYCNAGTVLTATPAAGGTVALTSASTSGVLNTTYTLSATANAGAGTGSYAGADQVVYSLTASAASGQWGAQTAADYTGTVDINVTF